ncbi:probable deoxyhypusine synthase [Monomorium pharaonis]|uniref:probable deoxyhypusine synthase n=1 Tax=Monomorium pharaonis TaxID=307658 RepID=UPI0017469106|nr:probable deoxyhypusine synthase [Monomorium pharaonis]
MANAERKDLQEEELAKSSVLVSSSSLPPCTILVKATNFGLAIEEVNRMLHQRNILLVEHQLDEMEEDEFIKRRYHCTIFLGYTSNMVSSGIRDIVQFLVQHKLVDCLVTTAGGVKEDFIKCLAPTYVGSFHLDDRKLRENGLNRTGKIY